MRPASCCLILPSSALMHGAACMRLTACFSLPLQVFGDSFLHGGREGTGPRYVDPQELLSKTTVDPYVPYQ